MIMGVCVVVLVLMSLVMMFVVMDMLNMVVVMMMNLGLMISRKHKLLFDLTIIRVVTYVSSISYVLCFGTPERRCTSMRII